MRLHRFIGNFDLTKKNVAVQDPEMLKQWRTVLRLKTGDRLIVSDGRGHEAEAIILDMGKNDATLSIEDVREPHREPAKKVRLYSAMLKRENFELVVQKATEAGVSEIIPVLTERTVKTGWKEERLLKILREAAEQSGRTTIPRLASPVPFKEAVEMIPPENAALFDLSGTPIKDGPLPENLIVGPEGGFSETEVALAREKGLPILSLGGLTLRAETAAIVVSFLATR